MDIEIKESNDSFNRDQLGAVYLDWVNNYLSLEVFAQNYGLHVNEAELLLFVARLCHEQKHPEV